MITPSPVAESAAAPRISPSLQGVDPAEFWQDVLAKRSDLDNSDESKLKYIRESLANSGPYNRWSLFGLVAGLLEDKSKALGVVSEMIEGNNAGDATQAFTILSRTGADYEALGDYVNQLKEDRLRRQFGSQLLKVAVDLEDASKLVALSKRISGDAGEEARNLGQIQKIITMRFTDPLNRDKVDFNESFIDELASKLPGDEAVQLKLAVSLNALEKPDVEGVTRLSESLEIPASKVVGEVVQHPKQLEALTGQDAIRLAGLLSPESGDNDLIVASLVTESLKKSSPAEVRTYFDDLSPPHQMMVLPNLGYQIAAGSGRQAAFEFASGLDQSQLPAFNRILAQFWDETGTEGPSLKEFKALETKR